MLAVLFVTGRKGESLSLQHTHGSGQEPPNPATGLVRYDLRLTIHRWVALSSSNHVYFFVVAQPQMNVACQSSEAREQKNPPQYNVRITVMRANLVYGLDARLGALLISNGYVQLVKMK